MNIKHIILYSTFIASTLFVSCSNEEGRAYMPDMSYSRAYEFYSDNPNMPNGITAQAPVAGTIARGAALPDHIGEFDTLASKANTCSLELSEDDIKEGGRIYQIHCGVCHGNNLDGNGPLYNGGEGKYPAAPANFKDAKYLNMPVGTMYHAIMYGKNLMGSYASQLDYKQRWMVLSHIKKIQSENGGAPLANSFKLSSTIVSAANAKEESAKVMAEKASSSMPAEKMSDASKEAVKGTKEEKSNKTAEAKSDPKKK
jgi:mono/diheme cytochrome c family protein